MKLTQVEKLQLRYVRASLQGGHMIANETECFQACALHRRQHGKRVIYDIDRRESREVLHVVPWELLQLSPDHADDLEPISGREESRRVDAPDSAIGRDDRLEGDVSERSFGDLSNVVKCQLESPARMTENGEAACAFHFVSLSRKKRL